MGKKITYRVAEENRGGRVVATTTMTCQIGNFDCEQISNRYVFVAPPQWLIEPRDTQVVLLQSARVDCLASGSPKPFTTWKRATGKFHFRFTFPVKPVPVNLIKFFFLSKTFHKASDQEISKVFVWQSLTCRCQLEFKLNFHSLFLGSTSSLSFILN